MSSKVRGSVRKATVSDAALISPFLRDADREEVHAACGLPPECVLPSMVYTSNESWTMYDDEAGPFGIFGVSGDGIIWMLSTPRLEDHSIQFLRECRGPLWELHQKYPLLWNYVDARNTVHHRWLRWMGFKFLRKVEEYGYEKRPFYQFARIQ